MPLLSSFFGTPVRPTISRTYYQFVWLAHLPKTPNSTIVLKTGSWVLSSQQALQLANLWREVGDYDIPECYAMKLVIEEKKVTQKNTVELK